MRNRQVLLMLWFRAYLEGDRESYDRIEEMLQRQERR